MSVGLKVQGPRSHAKELVLDGEQLDSGPVLDGLQRQLEVVHVVFRELGGLFVQPKFLNQRIREEVVKGQYLLVLFVC
jgi:hypothetical protein